MFRLKIKIVEQKPPDIVRDVWRDVCRRGFAHIARLWFDEIFPKHFEPQARHKYDHKARGKKYNERKQRLASRGMVAMGGLVDNVLTGAMMRALKSSAIIRGFPTRGKIEMRGPNYLKMNFRKSSNQPDKKRELTATTKQEREYLLREFHKFVCREFNAYRATRVTTIGG